MRLPFAPHRWAPRRGLFPWCDRFLGGLLLAFPLLAGPAIARDAAAQVPADSGAVRAVWSELDRLWNERAAEGFAALFAEDASFVFVDRREALEGRGAILDRFSPQFSAMAPQLRHRTVVNRVRVVTPDVQTMDGRVEILRESDEAGREPELVTTFAVFAVMERVRAAWTIRILRVFELRDLQAVP